MTFTPTVTITLEEYDRLRSEEERLQAEVTRLTIAVHAAMSRPYDTHGLQPLTRRPLDRTDLESLKPRPVDPLAPTCMG